MIPTYLLHEFSNWQALKLGNLTATPANQMLEVFQANLWKTLRSLQLLLSSRRGIDHPLFIKTDTIKKVFSAAYLRYLTKTERIPPREQLRIVRAKASAFFIRLFRDRNALSCVGIGKSQGILSVMPLKESPWQNG
jgi:hypothetical protein